MREDEQVVVAYPVQHALAGFERVHHHVRVEAGTRASAGHVRRPRPLPRKLLEVGVFLAGAEVVVGRHATGAEHGRADVGALELEDRKSTRLNSSHVKISYAV